MAWVRWFWQLMLVCGLLWVGNAQAISNSERAALVALYSALDGPNWTVTRGWDIDAPPGGECFWDGVICGEEFTKVVGLQLLGKGLQGTLPPEIGDLIHLEVLDLTGNQISGTIPAAIGQLTRLVELHLLLNKLTGPIPDELVQLPNLEILDLSYNEFSGELPANLAQAPSLRELYLTDNYFSGAIPAQWGGFAALEKLRLSNNQLSGSIPPELSQLSQLKLLFLDHNALTGEIPPQLSQLSQLRSFNVEGNRLEGAIPQELGNMTQLGHLGLSGNRLTGEIPNTLVNLTGLFYLTLGYNALVSSDPDVILFLEGDPETNSIAHDIRWRETQTRAPENLRVDWLSANSITLTWDPVSILGEVTGGYQVWYGTDSDGPWPEVGGQVADLNADRLTISNLAPETTYYFIIRTWSDPHDGNSSTLWSYRAPDAGSDLVATTLAAVDPDPDPDPDTDGDGIPDGADADLCQPTAMNLVADISYQGQGNTRLQSTEGVQAQGDGMVEVVDAHELIVEAPYFLVSLGTEFRIEAGSQMRVIPAEPSCQ